MKLTEIVGVETMVNNQCFSDHESNLASYLNDFIGIETFMLNMQAIEEKYERIRKELKEKEIL